jgi:glycosyltransferase involved in cell wall biosynthesis
MTLAIDCRLSQQSGIGVYLDNILIRLLEQASEDHFVLIGDPEVLAPFAPYPSCRIVPFTAKTFSLRELFAFPLREVNRCDAYYSPHFNLPLGLRIPVYTTIHDVVFLDVNDLVSPLGRWIRKLFLGRACRVSKTIFTVSEFSKSRITFHFPFAPEIKVAHSGINRALKAFVPKEAAPWKEPYVLFIGNIKKQKGLHLLLDAYEKALSQGFTHKLVIVGEHGRFRSSDQSVVKRLEDQKDKIRFTGKIDNPTLYTIIANADLLVQPSVYEGFGLPPLEALYLGCNALISDIPVFKEVYAQLPVIFFKSGQADDLAKQLHRAVLKPKNGPEIRESIDALYSLDRTATCILNHIKQDLNA